MAEKSIVPAATVSAAIALENAAEAADSSATVSLAAASRSASSDIRANSRRMCWYPRKPTRWQARTTVDSDVPACSATSAVDQLGTSCGCISMAEITRRSPPPKAGKAARSWASRGGSDGDDAKPAAASTAGWVTSGCAAELIGRRPHRAHRIA